MARFLLAWELGGGLGHVVPLAQVARALIQRGHNVHLALRDLSDNPAALGEIVDSPQLHLWQAPVWLPTLAGARPPASFPEILLTAGYLHAQRLRPGVLAWRSLLAATAPDLLVCDHAPTALLAARDRPLKTALFGTGFFQPPAVSPMPAFRDWEPVDPRRLAGSEARVLATCNEVLAADGLPPMAALHEMLAADESFLLTWPELDHYADSPAGRPGATYWGVMPSFPGGAAARWPPGAGVPIFAYLRADHPGIGSVLDALANTPLRTLAHVGGLAPSLRRRYQGTRLTIAEGPVDLATALPQAQAVLCHGSGTMAAALQAGRPVVMLPTHAEQLVVARRVADAGAGVVLTGPDAAARLAQALATVLADGPIRRAAAALAAAHPARPEHERVGHIAERMEACARRA